jgi:hypothetical protein
MIAPVYTRRRSTSNLRGSQHLPVLSQKKLGSKLKSVIKVDDVDVQARKQICIEKCSVI